MTAKVTVGITRFFDAEGNFDLPGPGLDNHGDNNVSRITENVLRRFAEMD